MQAVVVEAALAALLRVDAWLAMFGILSECWGCPLCGRPHRPGIPCVVHRTDPSPRQR